MCIYVRVYHIRTRSHVYMCAYWHVRVTNTFVPSFLSPSPAPPCTSSSSLLNLSRSLIAYEPSLTSPYDRWCNRWYVSRFKRVSRALNELRFGNKAPDVTSNLVGCTRFRIDRLRPEDVRRTSLIAIGTCVLLQSFSCVFLFFFLLNIIPLMWMRWCSKYNRVFDNKILSLLSPISMESSMTFEKCLFQESSTFLNVIFDIKMLATEWRLFNDCFESFAFENGLSILELSFS